MAVDSWLVQYTIYFSQCLHTRQIPRIAVYSSSEDGENDLQGKQNKESAED
jgi:hypothetical protein